MTYEIIRKLLNEAIKVQADEQTHEDITLNTKVFIEDDDDDEDTYSVDNEISYVYVRDSFGNYKLTIIKNLKMQKSAEMMMIKPDGA